MLRTLPVNKLYYQIISPTGKHRQSSSLIVYGRLNLPRQSFFYAKIFEACFFVLDHARNRRRSAETRQNQWMA